MEVDRKFSEESDRIETFRQGMTPEEQADFIRESYLMIDEESQDCYFKLIYRSREQAKRERFQVITGGRKTG